MKKIIIGFQCALLLSACSPVMEVMRPDPVDLSQFVVGENRLKVIAEVGNPLASEKDGVNSCDVYKFYTKGPDGVGKGAIAAGEAVGDFMTFGLSEIAFTPAEAATRNSKHTVLFCYTAENKLVSVSTSGTAVDN